MKTNSPPSALPRLILIVLIIFLPKLVSAQGTLYVSSFATESRYGGPQVANDSWIAEQIETGDNANGYVLDSVELLLDTEGPGSGFAVSIYSDVNNLPSTDLGNLSGNSDPSSGYNIYSASGLSLAASTEYFIVVTAATPGENSPFSWIGGPSLSATGSDQWMIGGLNLVSSDQGSAWTSFDSGHDMQMAIYATEVPEPSPWILCLLGGGLAFYFQKHKQRLTEM
jgi:hypothetical protein